VASAVSISAISAICCPPRSAIVISRRGSKRVWNSATIFAAISECRRNVAHM
jgi:hypothetical protein